MTQSDVLIIHPGAPTQVYQQLGRSHAAIEPPIWASLLANALIAKNKNVEILDCEALHMTLTDSAQKISESSARLVAVVVYGQQPSASTQNMYAAGLLCKEIRKISPEKKIIMLGGHPSALPEQTLREETIDFVALGEGFWTLLALMEVRDLSDECALKKVPGLMFRVDSEIIKSEVQAPLISQAELSTTLPGQAFHLLPMDEYRAHNWHCFDDIHNRQPYASVYTSLGCPFKCSFCCINAPFGGSSFRYWDPEFTIQQFETLAIKYNVKNIKIADEMFVLNEKHFLKLCHLLKDRDYKFNIWAYSRIDTVKPHHLEVLKSAGVNWLALGIESKSKFVRDGVDKGRFQDDDIVRVVRQIQEAGIYVIGNYIFGLPDDTLDSMTQTLDLAMKLNCEMANFYSAMAYPGSALYDLAIKENWPLPDSWLGYSQHAYETKPLPTRELSAGEVLSFRDHAWKKYFKSESYQAMTLKKFGAATLEHIQEMTRIELKRKFLPSLEKF